MGSAPKEEFDPIGARLLMTSGNLCNYNHNRQHLTIIISSTASTKRLSLSFLLNLFY